MLELDHCSHLDLEVSRADTVDTAQVLGHMKVVCMLILRQQNVDAMAVAWRTASSNSS